MNVLIIGQDTTLFMDEREAPSNTRKRMVLIGEGLSKLCIAVLVSKTERERELELSDKVSVYAVPFHGRPPSFWKAYKICSRICQENKIDVISTQDALYTGVIGYLLKKKHGIPLNIQIHGYYLDNLWWLRQGKTNFLLNRMARILIKRADTIRAVSQKIKESLINYGIEEERIFTFPIVLDNSTIRYEKAQLNSLVSKGKNVLFVGNLTKLKAVDTLLYGAREVVKKIPDAIFIIIGEGPERVELEKLGEALNIKEKLRFLGQIPFELVSTYYEACDILVLPSRAEGWGRVVIEALAYGKPVIVSDACGVAGFVVENKCGFSFPVDDYRLLAEKVLFLLENSDVAKEMGERGREAVLKNLSHREIVPKYFELWQKTIELVKSKK